MFTLHLELYLNLKKKKIINSDNGKRGEKGDNHTFVKTVFVI